MADIEDTHLCSSQERRLRAISQHVSGVAHPCSRCLAPSCTAAAIVPSPHRRNESTRASLDLEGAMKSTSWPIKNPYAGRMVDIDEIRAIHTEYKSKPGSLDAELTHLGVDIDANQVGRPGRGGGGGFLSGGTTPGPMSILKSLREEGGVKEFVDATWPFNPSQHAKFSSAPEHQEALDQFVANIKRGKPSMFADPLVMNGYNTHADPARFEAEVKTFSSEVNIVGLSQDLPKPNDFLRFDAFGKSMILTRDKNGRFHCFENSCRHRGAQLVSKQDPIGNKGVFVCPYHSWSYSTDGTLLNVPFEEGFDRSAAVDIENRNLIELPSSERSGVLFVIPCPKAGVKLEDMEQILSNAVAADLLQELEHLEWGNLTCVIEQEMSIQANWKMGIDTFCETYHFSSLHPGLREFLVPGIQYFRTFGGEGDDARNVCMTLGQFTTSLIANGEVTPEQISQTDPLHHLIQVYHLAPNIVANVDGNGSVDWFQFWPGSTPGHSTCTYRKYVPKAAARFIESSPQMKALLVASATGIFQVVACEDFEQMPRMQQNYAKNSVAQVVFGRNEPCLQNRHKYYMKALRENGYGDVL